MLAFLSQRALQAKGKNQGQKKRNRLMLLQLLFTAIMASVGKPLAERAQLQIQNADPEMQIEKHKKNVRCRYMLMSLGEAHQLAVTTGLVTSRSKFCSLRPKQMELMEDRPHKVCVCVTHDKMRMPLQVSKPHINARSCQTKFSSELVCDPFQISVLV